MTLDEEKLIARRLNLAANDAVLFAGMVDAVLLVVGAGSANLDEIKRAEELLVSIGTPIIGAVLNRFKPRLHGALPTGPTAAITVGCARERRRGCPVVDCRSAARRRGACRRLWRTRKGGLAHETCSQDPLDAAHSASVLSGAGAMGRRCEIRSDAVDHPP
jgi:hypothetical protein